MSGVNLLLLLLPIVARFVPQLAPFVPLINMVAPIFKQVDPEAVTPLARSLITVFGQNVEVLGSPEEALRETTKAVASLHQMTPEEENLWMDRASQVFG